MFKRLITKIQIIILLIGFGMILPALAAELDCEPVFLSLSVNYEKFLDPDCLYAEIIVSPGVNLVNAVAVDLNFPADMLALEAIDFDQSFCSITACEAIDNTEGRYRLVCGSADSATSGIRKVARLKFNKLAKGWAKLSFGDETAVLAHDGRGTALPILAEVHRINIIK